jgi:hypothetical protein
MPSIPDRAKMLSKEWFSSMRTNMFVILAIGRLRLLTAAPPCPSFEITACLMDFHPSGGAFGPPSRRNLRAVDLQGRIFLIAWLTAQAQKLESRLQ